MRNLIPVVLCCSVPLSGYAKTDTELYNLNLTELMKMKVLVASKTEQTIEKAPSTVTLFTRQDIKRLGIKSVADILAYVPGFQVTRNDSNNLGHSFQARGRFTFTGNSVLVLLDNQRLNDEWTGGVNWTNHLVSTLNIKRIEVIRGPGSALYGSNAFNAVVNIITDTELNETAVEVGSFNSKQVHVASANKFGDIETSVFFDYFDDDGDDYTTREGSTSDPVRGYEFSGYLKSGDFFARARYVFREAEDFYQFGNIDNDINKTTARNRSIAMGYKFQPTSAMNLNLHAYYSSNYYKSFFQVLDQPTMEQLYSLGIAQDPSAVISGPLYRLNDMGLSVDGQYNLSDIHNLSFGLNYRRPDMETLRAHGNHELADITNILVLGQPGQIRYYGGDPVTTLVGDETHRTIVGLYMQDQMVFSESWEATLGMRYDRYNDFGSTTNPRASLVYSLNENHSFKLIYGEAFRAPSIGDTTVRNNPVEKSNPDLLPEEVATSEFAWIYKTNDFRMISTLYYSKFDNVHVHTLYEQQPPLTIRVNQGTLEVSGIELETRTQFNDTYSLDFNWSHSVKLAEDPQTLARNTASIALNANFGRWEANLNISHRDKVEHQRLSTDATLERVYLDDYWLFSINGRYKWTDNLIAKVSVDNLFDKDYYQTFSSAETLYDGMISRGRKISLALEWTW